MPSSDPIETSLAAAECVGRYVLYPPIARGGMATVHAARLVGTEGFSRLVAAKRLHPHLVEDPDFIAMFHDEARIASRIHHPNVVPVLDVVTTDREVVLVQEYVQGVALSVLMRNARSSGERIPPRIAVAIVAGILAGLHAAHEATDELGFPLEVIHRDVSPQNVMIGIEGTARLLDFGIAKARTSAHHTQQGVFKGKPAYMAPEQIRMETPTRRVDVYAAGVLAWELLANRRVNEGKDEVELIASVLEGTLPGVDDLWKKARLSVPEHVLTVDAVVSRARAVWPGLRYATAAEMQEALLGAHEAASQSEVAAWLRRVAGENLVAQQRSLAANEENWRSLTRISTASTSASEATTLPRPIPAYVPEMPAPGVAANDEGSHEVLFEEAVAPPAHPPSSSRALRVWPRDATPVPPDPSSSHVLLPRWLVAATIAFGALLLGAAMFAITLLAIR